MAQRESKANALLRWRKVELLQKHYANFVDFLRDGMKLLGFSSTEIQEDIAWFLQHGPQQLMVQAQRGEAKTTITAMFAVWCLIHDPKHRVLIVSAGGKTANEIATLVQRVILTMDVLECLRPDASAGDRTSVEAFDVHHSIKGVDKSPSVACVGITGNLPGKRADLLIADDIESTKNAMTAAQRAIIQTLSLEFDSICANGRIVYLGTPQTTDSIYNALPGQGYVLRVWPGRYPTPAEEANYGTHLAPLIKRRMELDPTLRFGGGLNGDRGKPTDPQLLGEEALCRKEARGAAYFNLNYMLDTKLSDALRFPLKTSQLIMLRGLDGKNFPHSIARGLSSAQQITRTHCGVGFMLALPQAISDLLMPVQGVHMQIDPAGGGANGDETGYCVTALCNSTVYVLAIGGIKGGYGVTEMEKLAAIAAKWKPNVITIEKNMGHGGFAQVWLPILRKQYKEGSIEEPFVTGQKEKRICGTLEPVMGRGALVFTEEALEEDKRTAEEYGASGIVYSVLHQLSKMTTQKNCVKHDDRADALEGSVRHWTQALAVDEDKAAAAAEKAKLDAFMRDPFGHNRSRRAGPAPTTTMMSRFAR